MYINTIMIQVGERSRAGKEENTNQLCYRLLRRAEMNLKKTCKKLMDSPQKSKGEKNDTTFSLHLQNEA